MMRQVVTVLIALSLVPLGFGPVARAAGNIYYFNGREFLAGKHPDVASIFIQDGYLPFVQSGEEASRAARLPDGTGGLVLLCYVQSAGGKIKSSNSYLPIGGAPVEITGEMGRLAVRADQNGYVVLAIPSGLYEARLMGMSRKVKIEKGKNALLAIRGGKRMVD